jgi:hypothetical protein
LVKEKGKKKEVIFVDSNIFVIDLRYKKDKDYHVNKSFLGCLYEEKTGITSVSNLLEVCGILSFSLNQRQVLELYHYLPDKYRVEIIPSPLMELSLPQLAIRKVFEVISRKVSFGDAFIISLVESYVPHITHFISWNAVHFKSKISVSTLPKILNPEEFLRDH